MTQEQDTGANNWFHPDFDKEFGEELVESVQELIGCFECGAPAPKNNCSRCKLAKYCNQECQVGDWKKIHKGLCRVYCENKAPQGASAGGAVPICLMSVSLLSEEMFVQAMRQRRTLFIEAASKSKEELLTMAFSSAVVPMFGKLRVVASPSFIDDRWNRHVVSHILLEVVDDDPQQEGRISNEALEKVVDAWVEFFTQLKFASVRPLSVTCGSRLFDRLDELTPRLESKGIHLPLMPSVDMVL